MFVIGVENPAKYGLLSMADNYDSQVYREDAKRYK